MGRLREETRALRLLTQQAVEERAQLAAKALVRHTSFLSLPCHAPASMPCGNCVGAVLFI